MDESEVSEDSFENPAGLRIEFKSEFLAEAVDRMEETSSLTDDTDVESTWCWEGSETHVRLFYFSSKIRNYQRI